MQRAIWIPRILASVILLQTLFFKFTGASESIFIFEQLGVEPFGRIGSGLIELIVVILILTPKWTKLGSLGAAGVMLGAIASHLLILGIEVQNDGGLLFILALVTLMSSLINLFFTKEKVNILGFQF